jgi:uncharacterized membrane protein YjfL (UPF0719 family)
MVAEHVVPMAYSLIYIVAAFALLWVAKAIYTSVYRRVDLKKGLFEQNNLALAISTVGYLFGIIIALGGLFSGESRGLQADLTGIVLYGLLTILLMIIASFICEKILLPRFDNTKEVVEDQNIGTAFVEAGVHIANGLILLAIQQGTGPWWSGLVLWGTAQGVLVVAGLLYEWVTPHNIHEQLEGDNGAVGLAFGGGLVGMGNIISLAVAGDFHSWTQSLAVFAGEVVFGLIVLFILKKLTDAVLAPRIRLSAEQTKESPNLGAGLLEAFGYVGGSMLVAWVF